MQESGLCAPLEKGRTWEPVCPRNGVVATTLKGNKERKWNDGVEQRRDRKRGPALSLIAVLLLKIHAENFKPADYEPRRTPPPLERPLSMVALKLIAACRFTRLHCAVIE